MERRSALKLNFTKTSLLALPNAKNGERDSYQDIKVPSLRLRVTDRGHKSFHIQRRGIGRIKLGNFPDLSVDNARRMAETTVGQIAEGINPVAEKKRQRAAKMTLREVLEHYLEVNRTKGKKLKDSTKEDYKRALKTTVGDWLDEPMASIDEDMVKTRYRDNVKISVSRTNNCFKVLRLLFNFAKIEYRVEGQSMFPDNPVLILTGQWEESPTNEERHIKADQLQSWYEAVMDLPTPVTRTYLLFLLFTGCRRTEAATLRCEDVNLKGREFTLHDTKNRKTVTLPLPNNLAALLAPYLKDKTEFVFPGYKGPLQSAKRAMAKVEAASGVSFSLHDIRRTFASIAGDEISGFNLKYLLNHSTKGDVTSLYYKRDMKKLKVASNKVSKAILRLAESGKKAEVVALNSKSA